MDGPVRQFPSAAPGEGQCAVCGFALPPQAARCEMCGSPRLRDPEPTTSFLCPRCRGEIVAGLACPHCGLDLLGPAREHELRIRCPLCQAEVPADSETCPSCKAALFAAPASAPPPPAVVRCPSCQREASEDEAECTQCGHTLWQLAAEAWRTMVREHLEKATVELRLGEADAWIDLGDARWLLEAAEEALEDGRFPMALRTADLCARTAQGTRVQALVFLDAYRGAVARSTAAKEGGGDIGACQGLLRLSAEARSRKEYKEAVQLAIRSKLCAEEALASRARSRAAD